MLQRDQIEYKDRQFLRYIELQMDTKIFSDSDVVQFP